MSAGTIGKPGKGCLLYELAFADRARLSDKFSAMLPPESLDVTQGAIERNAHVSVAYGFDPDPSVEVDLAELLAATKPLALEFGKVGLFEAPTHDCLHIEVSSPAMEDLHYRIRGYFGARFDCKFPVFHAHCTMAYINKGAGAALVGDLRFAGETYLARELTYSVDRAGKRERSLFVLGQPRLSESISLFLARPLI